MPFATKKSDSYVLKLRLLCPETPTHVS